MDKNSKLLAAGAAFLVTVGLLGTYVYKKAKAGVPEPLPAVQASAQEEEKKVDQAPIDPNWAGFEDPGFSMNQYLTQVEAEFRASIVSDVSYLLCFGLTSQEKSFNGKVTIDFKLSKKGKEFEQGAQNSECLFIDFKGKLIRSLVVNGTRVGPSFKNIWVNHRIYLPPSLQVVGQNKVTIEYESLYVSDCQGMQYFKDDADGSEYVYSELEPDYCHIVFPCFDQPDLKACHKTCILAPSDWEVITNSEKISNHKPVRADGDDQEFKAALNRFEVARDSAILQQYRGSEVRAHEFSRTQRISTYLFCFVAGAFDCLLPSEERIKEEPQVALRLYCRRSLVKYAEKMKDDWFRITKASIRYYEQMFDQPYPFDKLDSVFCPDYSMGAMENVGCITYNDDYIERDEHFTRYKKENIFNTIAHEISHQWFGNLVTMKWWDGLWLNESFANMISFMAMDEGTGMEDVTLTWNIFVDEQYSGINADQKDTSHAIQGEVTSTGTAQDNFDGISYGKGAAFLHQMVFLLGKDVLQEGLKTYFAKHKFGNTELNDFIGELCEGAKRLGKTEIDIQEWSNKWLLTPGLSEFTLDFQRDEASGSISDIKLKQVPYNQENIKQNQLRVQAFNISALDQEMKIIKTVKVQTSDSQATTEVSGLQVEGKKINAILLNQGAFGYGKFYFDEMTLQAFETGLHKIESSLDRKFIYNALYDALKSCKVPASRLMKIILNNLPQETAVDILQDTLRFVVPSILSKFLHLEVNENVNAGMFDVCLDMMTQGNFKENPSAMEMLVSSSIQFATKRDQQALILKWFETGQIVDKRDREIQGTQVNVKVRHTMVRKIFTSKLIESDKKKHCFEKLAELDQTDMLGRTQKYCEAAVPDEKAKREALFQIFERCEDLSLQHIQELCRGFRQFSQRDLIQQFAGEFFERIEDCVNTKAWSLTRYIYTFLVPSMSASDEELEQLNTLKARLESYSEDQKKEGTQRLLDWVKDSIQEVQEKRNGRQLSKAYHDQSEQHAQL